jgi:hypothetical protein
MKLSLVSYLCCLEIRKLADGVGKDMEYKIIQILQFNCYHT